jgi:outer membrane protein OmpA-like peptidoglycan-associated protein
MKIFFSNDLIKIKMNLKLVVASLFAIGHFTALALAQNPPHNSSKGMTKVVEFEVFKVHGLNSQYSEFSPVLFKQDFIFASNRQYDFNSIGEDNWSKMNHVSIFKADVRNPTKDSAVATKVRIFDNVFFDNDHTGPICFSADGKEAIFTRSTHRKQNLFGDKVARPQLYSAKLVDDKWSEIKKLPFVKVTSSYGHPSLSADGNILYYVSDDFGGTGGKDIWMVERSGGTWGEPKPLRDINTPGDELFPSVVDDNLYFSSNGRGGEGGLDLFVSKIKNNAYSAPESLGNTINSPYDDFGIVFTANRQNGYFTSNRPNGKGDDDIYYFKVNEKIIVEDDVLEGQFVYKKLGAEKPEGLDVWLLDEDGNMVMQTKTDANGEFKFRNLNPDQKYVIKLMKDGEEVELILYGKDADSYLIANRQGEFVFRKLSSSSVGTLSLIDEENIDPITRTGTMNGQFVFTKLKKDVPAGVEVFLIDEEGNIVDRTTTDANGNFQFSKLNMDKNYRVKIGDLDDDVNLLVFNKKDQVMAILAAGKDGVFNYRKLKTDKTNDLDFLQLEEGELQFADASMMLAGDFKYRKMGKNIAGLEYEILDEQYNLLAKGTTNDAGFFRELNIPNKEVVIFRIDGNQYKEDIDLTIVDRNKAVVVKLDKNANGVFVYKKLKSSSTDIVLEDELMNTLKGRGVNAQFVFKKLTGDKQGVDYELYDENGVLISKGKTNQEGVLSLSDLNPANFYKFKLLHSGDADLRIWDAEKGEMVLIKKSKDGFYEVGKKNKPISEATYTSGKILTQIFYDQNIYKIGGVSRVRANTIVQFMNDNPTAKIVVSAHTSQEGSESYNLELSRKRMQALVDFLINKGVSADRIVGEYHGETKPMIDCGRNCTEKDHANNRRTEVKFVN